MKVGHAVVIQPSNVALTVPEGPQLGLDERTASRHAFDAAVAQKQKQAEVMPSSFRWCPLAACILANAASTKEPLMRLLQGDLV